MCPADHNSRAENEPPWLDDLEQRAWRAWIEASTRISDAIERDLRADTGMNIGDYEVLVRLSEAPDQRLRMTELASQVMNSPSRLSQRIDRMADLELVDREPCPDDRRGQFAVLTPAGLQRLEDAVPDHVVSVRRHLIDRLSRDELTVLAEVLGRIGAQARDLDRSPSGAASS